MRLLRALAPGARSLALLARLPIPWHLWPADERWSEIEAPLDASFAETARLRERLAAEGFAVHVDVEPDVTLPPLRETIARTGADVVILGPFVQTSAAELTSWADDLTRSAGVPVVLTPRGDLPDRPAAHIVCPFDGDARSGVAGWLSGRARRRLVEHGALPVIVVPALPDAQLDASLDAPDLVATSRVVTLHVTGRGGRGHPAPLPDQDLAIVAEGRIALVCPLCAGRIRIDLGALGPGEPPSSIGIGRSPPTVGPPAGATDPLAVVDTHVALLRPGPRRVVLFDARLDGAALAQIRAELGGEDRLALGVRLALGDSVAALRARVAEAGFARPIVLDARAVLDEGEAADVPPDVDAVRLCRVAGRLRADGVQVDAVVHAPARHVLAAGFAALTPADLPSARERVARAFVAPPPPGAGPGARLDATTGALASAGNRVEIVLDNEAARRTLLDLVRGARARVHLQVYIVDDDALAREVSAALGEAAARGVTMRILVDALYSQHGAYGVTNPVLVALADRPGVTVLASRPLHGLPTIEALKQRDHGARQRQPRHHRRLLGERGAPRARGRAHDRPRRGRARRALRRLDAPRPRRSGLPGPPRAASVAEHALAEPRGVMIIAASRTPWSAPGQGEGFGPARGVDPLVLQVTWIGSQLGR